MKKFKKILLLGVIFFVAFVIIRSLRQPPLQDDWQEVMAVPSMAQFNGNQVTVKNVRNFRYGPTEKDVHPAYYDKTYDLTQLKKIWFVTEPFNENKIGAHTFLSFEFTNGEFLAISIEGRKNKSQDYNVWRGLFSTYPLLYIAADERDAVLLRANLRKDKVYIYPVKFDTQATARLLLTNMLNKMNELVTTKPEWYNTMSSNCTSQIAKHVNEISPDRISVLSWQLWLTASSDELALKQGLLDTDLDIEKARIKYSINAASEKAGDVPDYSTLIRQFGSF